MIQLHYVIMQSLPGCCCPAYPACQASLAAWDHCLPTKRLYPTNLDPSDLPVDRIDLHFVEGPAFQIIFTGKASGVGNQGCQGLGCDECCKGDIHIQGQPRLARAHRLFVPQPHLQSSQSHRMKSGCNRLAALRYCTGHVNNR